MKELDKVIVLIGASRGYDRDLLRGIAEYARLNGPWNFYRPRAFYLELSRRGRRRELGRLRAWGAHGIIMRESEDMDAVAALGLPMVVSAYDQPPVPGAGEIYVDNPAVGRMAAEHLLERGFRHYAFCGLGHFFWSRERQEGFSDRLARAGHTVHAYPGSSSRREGPWDAEQARLRRWLEGLPKPVGLMACIDERSLHVVEACRGAGIRIPEEVALVGGDNDSMLCDLSNPPVSSVAVSGTRGGYEAAALLHAMMRGKKPRESRVVVRPTRVVTRRSTDVLAIEDPHVATALHYIHAHAAEGIQVDDVVRQVPLSRRALQQRFRAVLDRSPHDEIIRARMARAARLLEETSLPISRIAMDVGFSETANFSRSFRQIQGKSPRAYREDARPR